MATRSPSAAAAWRAPLAALALLAASLLPARLAVAADLAMAGGPLASAVGILGDTPETRDLAAVLDQNAVSIRFTRMTPGIYARYSVARHAIEIDDRWSEADSKTLAAVLAHEAVHARDAVSGYLSTGGSKACIDSEVRAFRSSAVLWSTLYGPAGKPAPADELERQLNLIAERQALDPTGMETLVRQAYQDQCG